jgi:hypothetical protein
MSNFEINKCDPVYFLVQPTCLTCHINLKASSPLLLALCEEFHSNVAECFDAPGRPKLDYFVKYWDVIVGNQLLFHYVLQRALWWNLANEHSRFPEKFVVSWHLSPTLSDCVLSKSLYLSNRRLNKVLHIDLTIIAHLKKSLATA